MIVGSTPSVCQPTRVPSASLPISAALGVLGINGLAAYFGFLEVGMPKAGETVLVSTAAGAVGSCVGQLAKLMGCRVVGIAGGKAKCELCIDEFGYDAAVDYKASDFAEQLDTALPDGIDIYFGTFAKAVALIGAFVSSEPRVIEFLKANVRSQVFAKSLPMPIVVTARERLKMIKQNPQWREKLWENTIKLREGLQKIGYTVLPSESPVTPVLTQGSTDLCQDIMRKLREEHGVFVSGVAYPVVPRGTVLIRLIPTAAHNDEHIEKTLEAFDSIKDFVFAAAAEIAS